MNNKKAEKFEYGLFIVAGAITLSLFSFITQENNITGFAVESDNSNIESLGLMEFDDAGSLSTLSAGNYYIDNGGILYWTDDELTPPVARIKNVDELQKSKYIYIDSEGNVGYILDTISIENE